MITKEQIEAGIQQKIVRFIADPNMGCGTVCKIGEHWFYFGGETAEAENPNEFLQNADMNEVSDNIMEALLGIKKVDDNEYGYYEAVLKETMRDGGRQVIDTLRNRDEVLEKLWAQFADVPINPDTECIEAQFMDWGPGVSREEIWHWFDDRHSKGVAYLLYGGAENYVPEAKRLYGLSKLCFECESQSCQYNHDGECRFALVHERKPRINDVDGCIDYNYLIW